MNSKKARYLSENMDWIARRDRILLNNPVIMQGMGLAPLVVAATNANNALMLSVAVLLLLTPIRVFAAVLSQMVRHRLRALLYCGVSAVLYIPVYYALRFFFDVDILLLGVYLPMLVVEPLMIKRYEHPIPEKVSKAFVKGLRTSIGYVLVLMLMGCMRELVGSAALFGTPVEKLYFPLLPMANLPAGGFILLGLVCAAWRGTVRAYKRYVHTEAKRGL